MGAKETVVSLSPIERGLVFVPKMELDGTFGFPI